MLVIDGRPVHRDYRDRGAPGVVFQGARPGPEVVAIRDTANPSNLFLRNPCISFPR